MFETISILPLSFWVVIALLVGGGIQAFRHLRDGSGLPTLVVLGTVAVWYVGDAFYNDYGNFHAKVFKPDVLQNAWWQVAWFIAVFVFVTPLLHLRLNKLYLRRTSGFIQMCKHGVGYAEFQKGLTQLFFLSFYLWLVISVIAAFRLGALTPYYFFPFLAYKVDAWGRGRIGSGIDALLSVIFYLQMLVTAIFGVIAALATNRRIFLLALVCCLFSWPYFIFDRTRSYMLAVTIPGIICLVMLRIRGGWIKKSALLCAFFLMTNAWLGFIMGTRVSGEGISAALNAKGFSLSESGKTHHQGLNMFEELCWINNLNNLGMYNPNWGGRYFAELVNVIPRSLWHGKPLIGIDYAIARGQKGGVSGEAGVYATMSTGLIGQGVVNFGPILGPAFAAVLMSLWVAVLARLDLNIHELGYLPLYASGMILTFNLGRDITLITLYPFVFGWLAILWLRRSQVRPKPVKKTEQPIFQPQAEIAVIKPKVSARFPVRRPNSIFTGRKTGTVLGQKNKIIRDTRAR